MLFPTDDEDVPGCGCGGGEGGGGACIAGGGTAMKGVTTGRPSEPIAASSIGISLSLLVYLPTLILPHR